MLHESRPVRKAEQQDHTAGMEEMENVVAVLRFLRFLRSLRVIFQQYRPGHGTPRPQAQNAVPFTRFPADDCRAFSVVCSTKPPVDASGLRFIDTPSVPESAEP